MRNNIVILLLLFMVFSISAQDCGYKQYHALVEAATEHYELKKYEAAKENLVNAFSKVDFPLGKDLHLALAIARKCDDSVWAEDVAVQLAKGGVPLRYFVRLKKQQWYDTFKSNFQTYTDYYQENHKPDLRERFISLLELDRKFNEKYHQWRTKEIEMTLQELIDGATDVLSEFETLTNEYGFPNERLMGYNYNRRKNKVEQYSVNALMLHLYQRGELVFKNEIAKIVCDGGLPPRYEKTLRTIRGFGDSSGVKQEMEIRYKKFGSNK